MKRSKWWMALPIILLAAGMAIGCASQTTSTEVDNSANDAGATVEPKGVLKMATTTSTADTGLLDYLAPIFLAETGWELQWTAVGTGEALKLGENGDVDIVLVHAKASEEKFVQDGFGVERFQVMYNDFIIVGPAEPIAHNADAQATLKTVAEQQLTFVSRGDDSGTHKKELSIWTALDIDPATNPNYVEAGQGMGATLTMADEKNAYCLTDRGTWLKMKNNADAAFQIDIVCEGAPDLLNQYGVIAVNPEKHPEVNIEAANAFIEWIRSEKTQSMIAAFGVDEYGQALFTPNANS